MIEEIVDKRPVGLNFEQKRTMFNFNNSAPMMILTYTKSNRVLDSGCVIGLV